MTRKTVILIAAIIALGAVVVALWMYNRSHISVVTAAADFQVSAPELVNAFAKNEADANAQYGGKVIMVTGTLRRVLEESGVPILVVGDSTLEFGVSCYLDPERSDAAQDLSPGSTVTVKGICNGLLLDVMLDQAVVVPQSTSVIP